MSCGPVNQPGDALEERRPARAALCRLRRRGEGGRRLGHEFDARRLSLLLRDERVRWAGRSRAYARFVSAARLRGVHRDEQHAYKEARGSPWRSTLFAEAACHGCAGVRPKISSRFGLLLPSHPRELAARTRCSHLPQCLNWRGFHARACKIELPGPAWRYLYFCCLGRTVSGGKWHARLILFGVGARAGSGVLNIDRLRAHPRRRPRSSDGVSGAGRGSRARRSVGCSYAAVDGDVEREPLGKRALGGRVSAKIILIDTAYGPFPSKKREAAKTY